MRHIGRLVIMPSFYLSSFSLSSQERRRKKRKSGRFSFCSSQLQRIWLTLSRLKPTDLQLFAGVFSVVMVTSFMHVASTILPFRVEGILVSNQAGCLLFFFYLRSFPFSTYCVVHNRICIVIMKYVIGKAFG